ncbi:bifunctional biotin--[acetyl-CoA-carboxylase] ligase/biotin operon repressor BirA [Cellvibrio fibrivorans]|uniref:Bifunctional ligase/repressor BirA n=1 Tax=Cellvibrio fibrivorans TaxID=126350 RepID=A0ABU1V453_9GAMM|nr:bifunctional biotin--[acetyl-CoA-carboxylase] ligase/biotin operon repressor BirA [Cellvibrio fibrivorans]MDR7092251.1 BirA family biotin operon repressor/biotin-[acetyl-CoA-carboxylase] ligase [Cellvibrio fibrivorans]
MSEANTLEAGSLRQILVLLADGEFHSGEELGLLLGVSRAAVWKHLQKLEGLGIKLLSIKGRGYCIDGGLDLLDLEKIGAQIHSSLPIKLNLFPQIDSTNAYLMRHADPALQVCLAESQSAGRGRRGRVWVSPFAQNIYCSIGWGFEGGVAALEGLSLAVGLVIVRTLQRYGVAGLQLKWPNDVLYQDHKLAGVLIEMTGDPAGYCQVVIGVGINVAMDDDSAHVITQSWIDLRTIVEQQGLPCVSRNQLVAALIDELLLVLNGYEQTGFADYCVEWQSFNAHAGQMVELRNGNNVCNGICVGVNEVGALVLETAIGREIFHGGEISLRRVYDS